MFIFYNIGPSVQYKIYKKSCILFENLFRHFLPSFNNQPTQILDIKKLFFLF